VTSDDGGVIKAFEVQDFAAAQFRWISKPSAEMAGNRGIFSAFHYSWFNLGPTQATPEDVAVRWQQITPRRWVRWGGLHEGRYGL